MTNSSANRSSSQPRPRQERAIKTRNLILDTAADLLQEVGFDKLTTNLVCKRAGLTPPALYHYFPNKYSLVEELGKRLSDEQDAIVIGWLQEQDGGLPTSVQFCSLIRRLHENDLRHTSSEWIYRSLQAIKPANDPELFSMKEISEWCTNWLVAIFPTADRELIATRVRISAEAVFCVLTMLLANPDMDAEKISEETSEMITMFLNDLKDRERRT